MSKKTSKHFAQALGGRLIELRAQLRLHQQAMAKKMGISERVYRRYEAGEQVPGSDKLMALLDNLQQLNAPWLLTGSGRMFKSAEQPQIKELLLDILEGDPSIQRIVHMLNGLEPDDLEDVLHHVSERRKLRDLYSELRSMMNKLEKPAAAGAEGSQTG